MGTYHVITGKVVELEIFQNVFPSTKLFSKYLENLERIPQLVSVKPPMCHNTDTIWHTKNRTPGYTPQTTTKYNSNYSF